MLRLTYAAQADEASLWLRRFCSRLTSSSSSLQGIVYASITLLLLRSSVRQRLNEFFSALAYLQNSLLPAFAVRALNGTNCVRASFDVRCSCWRSFAFHFHAFTFSIACSMSAMMSSAASIPTDRRMRSGATPASFSCSSDSCRWV